MKTEGEAKLIGDESILRMITFRFLKDDKPLYDKLCKCPDSQIQLQALLGLIMHRIMALEEKAPGRDESGGKV